MMVMKMIKRLVHPGHIVTLPLIVLLSASIAWLAWHSLVVERGSPSVSVGASAAMPSSMRIALTRAAALEVPSLESVLRRVSLDPVALTAAGVTSQQDVGGVVSAVDDYLVQNGTAYAAARSNWADAKVQCEALERLVRSGRATTQEVSDLATAQSNLNSCRSSFDSALDGAFDAGVTNLATAVVTRLTAIRANRTTDFGRLPVQHLVESRSDADLLALRNALAEERICDKWNETPSSGTTTLLSTERARAEVAAAANRLDGSLATVESLWDSAIAQP